MRSARFLQGFVAGAGVVGALGPGAAAAEPETIGLVYRAHRGCPEADAFVAEVAARTSRARLAIDAELPRRFEVGIGEAEGRSIGRIEMRDPDGSRSRREVDARSCGEVVSALALIGALAIDPQALAQPAPGPAPSQAATGGATARAAQPPPAEPATESPRWGFGMGMHAMALGGLSPWVLPAGSAFVQASQGPPFPLVFRVSLAYAPGSTRPSSIPSTDARFWWWAVRGEACPLQIGLGAASQAFACATFDAGQLGAQGVPRGGSIQRASSDAPTWYAPGLAGRIDYALGRGVFVEAQGDLVFPLARQRFVFELDGAEHLVHRAAGACGAAEVGIGYHLP